jgi:hypothetical protein
VATSEKDLSEIISVLKTIAKSLGVATGVVKDDNRLLTGKDVNSAESKGSSAKIFVNSSLTVDEKKRETNSAESKGSSAKIFVNSSLTVDEKKRETEKARQWTALPILKTFFEQGATASIKSAKTISASLKKLLAIETNNSILLKNSNKNEESFNKTIGIIASNTKKDDKKESGGIKEKVSELFKSTSGIVGLVALGVGIYYIINGLMKASTINIGGAVKAIAVIGAFAGLFLLFGKNKANIVLASAALALLGAAISFVVIPMLLKIQSIDGDAIKNSLLKFTAIFGVMGIAIFAIGKIVTMNIAGTILGLVAIGAMSFLIGYLADNLTKLANKPWLEIGKGLGLASLAIVAFGLVVAGIGALVSTGVGAALLGIGIVAVTGLTAIMGLVADSVGKFDKVDGNHLAEVGMGLIKLGAGLVSFVTGIVGGAVGGAIEKFTSFFGVDIVSNIKKLSTIDADKMLLVGASLKVLSEGLRSLSVGTQLKTVTSDIIAMTSPLIKFASALDAFSGSYKKLSDTKSTIDKSEVYTVNVDSQNSVQNSILEMNKQDLIVQKLQLDQLKQNGEILAVIANSIGNVGSSGSVNSTQSSNNKVSSPSFSTKNNYLDTVKLNSMLIGN